MSDHEEDFDDFPTFSAENTNRPVESMVVLIVQNQQINGQLQVEKNPTLFIGPTSWFKYVELIDDCLDLTVLEAGKRGPALKNRLVGDTVMYKGLLNRESLRAEDGVKYFKGTLRPHFIKKSSEFL